MRAQQSMFDFDLFDMGGLTDAMPGIEDWQSREAARLAREEREAREAAERVRERAKREREARQRADDAARERARQKARDNAQAAYEDPWTVLGLVWNASKSDIRAAWARLCREFHPDVEGGSEDAIKRINAAYNTLKGRA